MGHLAYQTDGNGTILASFTYDVKGVPTSVTVGSDPTNAANRYYYVYNGHGDVIGLVDANGNAVATYAYDAWGVVTVNTESFANGWHNPYLYDGRDGVRYDTETGLYWMSVRAYDPTLGRFIARDPLGWAPLMGWTTQPYAYAGNNPLLNVDPSGQRLSMAAGADPRTALQIQRNVARIQARHPIYCNLACKQADDQRDAAWQAGFFHGLSKWLNILAWVAGAIVTMVGVMTGDPWVTLAGPAIGYDLGLWSSEANDIAGVYDDVKGWSLSQFNPVRLDDDIKPQLHTIMEQYIGTGAGTGIILTILRFVLKFKDALEKFKIPYSVVSAAMVVAQILGAYAMYKWAMNDVEWQERNLPLCPVGCF